MLTTRMVETGGQLFRWRSFLPLLFLPLLIWASLDGEVIEHRWHHATGEAVEGLAILMVVIGEAVRILTVGFVPNGTSGRNTVQGQIATRLNTAGLYSVVRNPLYLGNCLMYVGIALFTQHLWLVAVLVPVLALYYERIIAAEEAFLIERFGQPYADWAERTPAFWPRRSGWVAPDMPFSLRSAVRREHASIFGAVLMLYLIAVGLHMTPAGNEALAPAWHWLMATAVGLELLTLVLKRYTRVLNVDGR